MYSESLCSKYTRFIVLLLLRIFHSPLRSEQSGNFLSISSSWQDNAEKGKKLPLTGSVNEASVLFAFAQILGKDVLKKKMLLIPTNILICVGEFVCRVPATGCE